MEFSNLPGFKISPKSEMAKLYFKDHHLPIIDNFEKQLNEKDLAAAIWIPRTCFKGTIFDSFRYAFMKLMRACGYQELLVSRQFRRLFSSAALKYGSMKKHYNIVLRRILTISDQAADDVKRRREAQIHKTYSGLSDDLKHQTLQNDLILIYVEDDLRLLEALIRHGAHHPIKCLIFTNTATFTSFGEQLGNALADLTDFQNKSIRWQDLVFTLSDLNSPKTILHIKVIRLLLHLKGNNIDLGRKETINSLYERYHDDIAMYLNSGIMSLLSFIKYMQQPELSDLRSNFIIKDDDLDQTLQLLAEKKFIVNNSGKYTLTNSGSQLFSAFGMSKLPTQKQQDIEKAAKTFLEKWMFPISATYNATTKIFKDQAEIQKYFEKLYFPIVRQFSFIHRLKFWWNNLVGVSTTEKKPEDHETEIWDSEPIQFLFKVWKENVAGHKRGFRAEERERAEFIAYVYQRLQTHYEPEHREKFQRFKELAFSLKMARANNQAHIYLTFPFTIRPLKDLVAQYLNLAIITGEYELLLKRYPPYNHLLNLYSGAGDRTFMDLRRGLDILPFSYRLDFNFAVALNLHKVQSRRKECYITCPIHYDEEAEAIKEAEINNLQNMFSNIFKSPAYLGDVDYDEEGNVVLRDGKGGVEGPIPAYGPKRLTYIQTRDYLTLLKANPRPAQNSGLTIRFNLMEPVAALLTGMNEKRPVTFEEVITLWKCLELFQGKDIKDLTEVVKSVLQDKSPRGLKQATGGLLNELEKIRTEKGEPEAWKTLISKLLQGASKPLVQVLCHSMIGDGFEFTFSLWPLLTGVEVKYDLKTGTIETIEKSEHAEAQAKTHTPETKVVSKKKNQMPLLGNLQHELETLLTLIFTKHLDISGGTAFCRSEQIIAGEIARYCLETREDQQPEHRKRLQELLLAHYKIYNRFLEEYSAHVQNDKSVINLIDKLIFSPEERSQRDLEQIEQHIQKTRNNLISRGKNNRLLRFIDQDSIDVKIGDFDYSGRIVDEINFIKEDVKLQVELGELSKKGKTQVRKEMIEKRSEGVILAFKSKNAVHHAKVDKVKHLELHQIEMSTNREKIEREMKALKIKEDKHVQALESQRRILELEIMKTFAEIEYNALESMKSGQLKGLALFSLLRTCELKGTQALEAVLEESPNLLMAVSHEMHHEKEIQEVKLDLIKIIDKTRAEISPVSLSLLLEQNPENIMANAVYKDTVEKLISALEFSRLAPQVKVNPERRSEPAEDSTASGRGRRRHGAPDEAESDETSHSATDDGGEETVDQES